MGTDCTLIPLTTPRSRAIDLTRWYVFFDEIKALKSEPLTEALECPFTGVMRTDDGYGAMSTVLASDLAVVITKMFGRSNGHLNAVASLPPDTRIAVFWH
jgi:hypothetical protein